MKKSKIMAVSGGIAQLPLLVGLALMVVAIPVAIQLSQQAQEKRGQAAGEKTCYGGVPHGEYTCLGSGDAACRKCVDGKLLSNKQKGQADSFDSSKCPVKCGGQGGIESTDQQQGSRGSSVTGRPTGGQNQQQSNCAAMNKDQKACDETTDCGYDWGKRQCVRNENKRAEGCGEVAHGGYACADDGTAGCRKCVNGENEEPF